MTARHRIRSFAVAAVLAASASAFAQATTTRVSPADARQLIDRVDKAAKARDFAVLRSSMAQDFKWNFGPDGESADLAIQAWRKDSRYLRQMSDVLRRGCHAEGDQAVVCPGKGKTAFRAGFEKTPAGWRMTSFVEGD